MADYGSTARLTSDAVNRTIRSFVQALVLYVLTVVVPQLMNLLQDEATVWDWDLLRGLALTAGYAALAFIHRRFIDPSPVPSMLPPSDPGPPADPT
jgi:hypothetical protein